MDVNVVLEDAGVRLLKQGYRPRLSGVGGVFTAKVSVVAIGESASCTDIAGAMSGQRVNACPCWTAAAVSSAWCPRPTYRSRVLARNHSRGWGRQCGPAAAEANVPVGTG
jgi:hypothetical protein